MLLWQELRESMKPDLATYLHSLDLLHKHLCPRQILGMRIGLLGAALLNAPIPQHNKRILCFIETDGCFADGVMVATGCSIGHRTMRLVDYGKVAVTFADTLTGSAFRVWPRSDVRDTARAYAPECKDSWHVQLLAYQQMPDDALLCSEAVTLTVSLNALMGQPGSRVICNVCHEEIINQREEIRDGQPVCRRCAGSIYYQPVQSLSTDHKVNAMTVPVAIGDPYVS